MEEKKTPKQRSLTQKQLDVLKLLFRFRFGTSDLIACAQEGISTRSMRTRLTALEEKGMVIKKQDGRSKLEGKPAVYHLAAKGRAVLKQDGVKYSDKILNSIRANKDNSQRFIQHYLVLFNIFNTLSEAYGESLVFLTKSNTAADKFSYLPEQRPDVFMHLSTAKRYYFLYSFEDATPPFAHIRRLASLLEYEKSGKWEAATKDHFPILLIAASSKSLETQLYKRFKSLADDRNSDITFATTTTGRLLDGTTVWREEGDERVELSKI